ncbi:TonB-dependent receptor [Pontibacter sp. E15-1]|uniref:outer membrane beta-barrel family protein n=1 Tax=Pontibacter sp. E15-1 TaxID=2919918 RepID=UPI001F4FF2F7|nr:outer membrane beta-barrel family protein [Pontibacter sp. E15-1]MCJ8164869.1 TonB-dependent receptor [Pontibacter sp. E15-1]
MKQAILMALCLLSHALAVAQAPTETTGTVKGMVADSATSAPIGYVTVVVSLPDKDAPLKSTFSRDNGSFEISGLPLGTYKLILSYVGYKPYTLELPVLNAESPVLNVGTLALAGAAKQLQEVEVTTEQMLITQDVDKISYNVAVDPESKTLSALDMMRKVPMLSLDSDENIQLNGSGSFKVLVNGKNSTLFARNPKDVLRSMPASSIKRIEVITDPPAKYDAEGIGGIINIITTDAPQNGYNGSFSLGAGSVGNQYGSVNLTAKTGKLGFSGYGGASHWPNPKSTSYYERTDAATGTLLQQGSSESNSYNKYMSGEISYELDTLNLLSAKFGLNDSDNASLALQTVEEAGTSGALRRAFARNNDQDYAWKGYDLGLDFQHTFKRNKSQLLTLSYKIGNNENNSDADIQFINIRNYAGIPGTRTQNEGRSLEQTYQADYVHPFKKHSLEAGLKSILRDNGSDYFYRNYDSETNTYKEVPELSNEFDYSQNIYAAYTSASLRYDKWGVRLGTRLEQTVVDANFKNAGTVAEQNYLNLIPNVSLNRTFKNMSSLRLSYTQRIERPSLYFLNPYVNRTNEKSISFGNPNLQAATSHVISMGHSMFKGGNSLNSTLTHAFTNNAIQNYTLFNTADSVTTTTFGNIGKNATSTLSLHGYATFFDALSVNLNGSLSYVQLSGNIAGRDFENTGVNGYMFSNLSYKFKKNWRANANLGYYGPRVMLQGKSTGQFWNGFSVSKGFLKDEKASFNLSVQNPFRKYNSFTNDVSSTNFDEISKYTFVTRRVNVGFSYKFGKLKEDIRRTKRGIRNDDLKSGSDNSGGSGNTN